MASQSLPVASPPTVRVWDLPLRLFHWLLVVAVTIAFVSAEEGGPFAEWHMLSGWTAALLIVFRIVWGFVGGEHARFFRFLRPSAIPAHLVELFRGRPEPAIGHNPLGGVGVLVLLALVGAVVVTGAMLTEAGEDFHETLAWALLAVIGVHVLAVVLMSCLAGENLVAAMITGRKPVDRHPAARDARRAGPAAGAAAALAVVAAAYLISRYDPRAFQPRAVEASEQEAGPARFGDEQADEAESD